MTVPAAYVSLPKILLDGQANDDLSLDTQAVLVEETIEGLYRCEVSLSNYGRRNDRSRYLYLGRDILDFGKDFAVQLGPAGRQGQVFAGRISGLEVHYPEGGGSSIVVLAEDRLQDLRMTRRTRTFEDVSDEDVIRQIANDHSLTPNLTLDGPTYTVLAQVNQSDLAFIRERARSINAELWLEGSNLYAMSRTDRGDTTVDLTYGASLHSFSVRADLAGQCTELGVAGWDVAAKDTIEETAEESSISAELNGDTGGSSLLEQAFAARKERIVHSVPVTGAEAASLAKARYREIARRFVTGAGVADGDTRIRTGTSLNLSGLGGLFDGKYYVTRVRHTYDGRRGFRSEFDVERPGLGPADG